MFVPEEEGDGAIDGKVRRGPRATFEVSREYGESASGKKACGAGSRIVVHDVDPLVRVLRDFAVGEGVAIGARYDVDGAESHAFASAQDGGDVVRVDQAVEDRGDALQTSLDDRVDTGEALGGHERSEERVVAGGLRLLRLA